jgi:choline-sulfatase
MLALLVVLASCAGDDPAAGIRLLLLVSVDTLRADHIGALGDDHGLTPRIDALAGESQVFTSAYAPASHTLPSVTALLTGRYPEELGVWSNESVLPAGVPGLAGAFRAAGWNTAAVVSNWVLRRGTGLESHFDRYDDRYPQLEVARPMPERVAPDTTDAALAALDGCLPGPGARCFLWVHYQDPHGPYTPPSALRERTLPAERAKADGDRRLPILSSPFGPGGIPSYQVVDGRRDVAFYRAGYAAEVALIDRAVGRLLDALSERGLRESSVVVFTADHGESLGEDDYWFSHGELLSDAQVRVPLLLRVPGLPPARRGDLASLVDVAPTLVPLLTGQEVPDAWPGRSLLAPDAEQGGHPAYLAALRGAALPRHGIVDDGFKYVVELRNGVWNGRLSARDREDVDLTAPAPQVAARMRAKLRVLMRRYQRVDVESRGELSDADRETLEALGYLSP